MPFSPVANISFIQAIFAAPGGTASTSPAVMLGCGSGATPVAVLTPQVTGRIFVLFTGLATNANGDGTAVQVSFGTGAAPTNAGALAGTQIGQLVTITALTGVLTQSFAVSAIITGLAVPAYTSAGLNGTQTPVWIDLAFNAVTGGTSTITKLNIQAFEF